MATRPTVQSPAEIRRLMQQVFDELNRKTVNSASKSQATIVGGSGGGSVSQDDILLTNNEWVGDNRFLAQLILAVAAKIVSDNFVHGLQGRGLGIQQNEEGFWELQVDRLIVPNAAIFKELQFQTTKVFNGDIIVGRTGTGRAKEIQTIV